MALFRTSLTRHHSVPLKSELTPADLRKYVEQIRSKIDRSASQSASGEELNEHERRQLQGVPASIPEVATGQRIKCVLFLLAPLILTAHSQLVADPSPEGGCRRTKDSGVRRTGP